MVDSGVGHTVPVARPAATPASPPLAVPAPRRIFRLRLRLPPQRYLRRPFRATWPACWPGRRSKRGGARQVSAELRDVFARSRAMLKRRLKNPRREKSKIQIAFPCLPLGSCPTVPRRRLAGEEHLGRSKCVAAADPGWRPERFVGIPALEICSLGTWKFSADPAEPRFVI
jgi:hypothetical protein